MAVISRRTKALQDFKFRRAAPVGSSRLKAVSPEAPCRTSSRRRPRLRESFPAKRRTGYVPLKVPGRGSRRKRRLQTAEEKGRVAPPKRNQVIRNVPRPVSPTPAPGAAQVRNRPQSPTPSTRERRELSLAVARRRHERALVDMDVPVYYQFLASRNSDVEELLFRGMLVDISPAGMGLVGSLHPSLHEDDVAAQPPRMVLHLSLPFVQRDLMVVGRLRHLRHGEAAKQWHLGVAIEHLTPQAELAIRRFLVVLHTGRHGSVSRLAG